MTEIGILLPKSAFIFYFLYISGHMSSPIPNGRHYGYCTFYMFLLKTFTEMSALIILVTKPTLSPIYACHSCFTFYLVNL